MKKSLTLFIALSGLFASVISANSSFAQCSTTAAPTYSHSCSVEYFTTMSASGTGVTSTIALTGGGCSGSTTYFNDYATQGITASAGDVVTLSMTRATGYTAYLSVYVDLMNTGTYTSADLLGTTLTLSTTTGSGTYNFTIPSSGIVTGIPLHMRVFLTESTTGAPCSGTYGQTYDYYLQVGCPTTTTVSVTPSSAAICSGSGVTLSAGTGGSYSWSPATGLSATTGASVFASPAVATVYTVTSTAGCPGTGTASVTVNPTPSVAVTPAGPLTICVSDSVTLTQTSIAGDTYQWYNGTTAIARATSNSYTDTGAANVKLVVTGTDGCNDTSAAIVITTGGSPVPVSLSPTNDTTVCDSITLTATSGAGYTYQWYDSTAALTGATNYTYNATTTGSYYCSVTIPGSCTENTPQLLYTINYLAPPIVTFNGKTFRTTSGYASYLWYENGTAISGATFDTVLAHSDGNYTVQVTGTNGCKATSTVYDLTKLSVQQLNSSTEVSVYPNPATNSITIVAPVPVNAIITDPLGKIVVTEKSAQNINISYLASGMYLVELFDTDGKRLLVQKLVKN